MILEALNDLLRELNISCASPDQFLEHDLRLDFQERLCIREDIEERLHVVISDDEIESDLTILELAGLLSRKLLTTPKQHGFDGRLQEDIVIGASAETIRRCVLDVEAWPRLLPYVRHVRVTYDDGLYQEFTMDVAGRDGEFLPVRSVQRSELHRITYFQPEPACFLKHHCGDWFINPLSENATHLTIVQRWTLSPHADRMFRTRDGINASQQIIALLREQARVALVAWKQHLEPPQHVQHLEHSDKARMLI
jgi:ribosome-associated toxin RatA of RatAB toxin-antitoxin module